MPDLDMTRVLFGQHAVHVPAWLFVQDAGHGYVSFVGGSHVAPANPLRFGSTLTHQLVVGELVVRPHVVAATDRLQGRGLMGLLDAAAEVRRDEVILDPLGFADRLLHA